MSKENQFQETLDANKKQLKTLQRNQIDLIYHLDSLKLAKKERENDLMQTEAILNDSQDNLLQSNVLDTPLNIDLKNNKQTIQKINDLNKKIKECNDEISDLNTVLNNGKNYEVSLWNNQQEYDNYINRINTAIEKEVNIRSALESELLRLQRPLEINSNQKTNIVPKDLLSLKNDYHKLKDETIKIRNTIEEIQEQILEANKSLKTITNEIAEIEKENKSITKNLTKSAITISDISDNINTKAPRATSYIKQDRNTGGNVLSNNDINKNVYTNQSNILTPISKEKKDDELKQKAQNFIEKYKLNHSTNDKAKAEFEEIYSNVMVIHNKNQEEKSKTLRTMTFFFNKNPAFKLFIPEFISELENSDQKSKVEQTFASEIQNVTGNSGLEKLENYMNSVTNITDTLDSSYRQKAIETYLNDAMIKSLNKEEVLGITYNLTCGDWKNVDDTVKASIVQKLSTQREQLNNQLNNVSIQKSETDTLLNKNKAPDDCYTLFTDPIQKTKLIDLLTQNSKNNKEENRMFNTFSPEEFASKAPLNVLIEILKISDVINEKIKEKNNQEQDKTSTNQSKGLFGEACNAFYSLINLLYEIFFKNIVNALDAILPENTEQKAERQFRTNLKALKQEFESCATNQISREKPSAQTVTNSNEKLKHSDKFHREVNSFRDMVTKTTVHNSEKSH